MVPKGTFQNKKTLLYGNKVSQKKWSECQEIEEKHENDFDTCTIYRYHLVLSDPNDVAFHNYYLHQRKKAICKPFSSDDSDIFALFPIILHRNAE